MKVKLTLAYDGAAFAGWQFQPGVKTVQGELERCISCYLLSLAKGEGITLDCLPKLSGSGRTDAGVHARGQVASFAWPDSLAFDRLRIISALNGMTIPQLQVLKAEVRHDSFDARFSRHSKCYRYLLCLASRTKALDRGRAWAIGPQCDIKEMIAAAAMFRGEHDFSSFRASDCAALSAVRRLLVSDLSSPKPGYLCYVVQGSGFLKQMIRGIVGTLVEIGRGRLKVQDLPAIISAGNRSKAGPTAPACGLCLEWVKYEED